MVEWRSWDGACLMGLLVVGLGAGARAPDVARRGTKLEEVEVIDAYPSAVPAYTDAGTPVPVVINAEARPPDADAETSFLTGLGLKGRVTPTAPPDSGYSCHGWVFTGLRCHLTGDVVDVILRDNGYEQVREPRAGDVIVYRDRRGEVAHSGLVREAGDGGRVLIESKWGGWGRYLHRPEDQCYGPRYGYYRSPRRGHVLHGLTGSGQAGRAPRINPPSARRFARSCSRTGGRRPAGPGRTAPCRGRG